MGSIVPYTKADKATGKQVTLFRAYVRREGFASKSKVLPTKAAAKAWLRNNEAEVTLSKAGAGKTLKTLIDEFVHVGNCTWAKPSQLDFWIEQLGSTRVRDISHADINGAILTLQSSPAMRSTPNGAVPTKQKRSSATINRYLAALSKVLSFGLSHGVIDHHPMKGGKVSKLKEGAGRTRILNADEEQALYEAARKSEWPMMYLFLRLVLTTSARKSEAHNLKWRQLRLDQSIAVIGKTKNGHPRALPLVSDVKTLLEEAAKVRPLKGDYVFFDPKRPEQVKTLDAVWKKCRSDAGLLNDREDPLDRVVLHTTRHTAVTKMLRGGANLAQVAAVSGHQTLAMLKRYEHLAASDSVELAEKLLGGKRRA